MVPKRANSIKSFFCVHRGGCDGLIFGKDEIVGEDGGSGPRSRREAMHDLLIHILLRGFYIDFHFNFAKAGLCSLTLTLE